QQLREDLNFLSQQMIWQGAYRSSLIMGNGIWLFAFDTPEGKIQLILPDRITSGTSFSASLINPLPQYILMLNDQRIAPGIGRYQFSTGTRISVAFLSAENYSLLRGEYEIANVSRSASDS